MLEKYTTVVIADEKGRVNIPAKVRDLICLDEEYKGEKFIYNLSYDLSTNEITLIPIGKTTTK